MNSWWTTGCWQRSNGRFMRRCSHTWTPWIMAATPHSCRLSKRFHHGESTDTRSSRYQRDQTGFQLRIYFLKEKTLLSFFVYQVKEASKCAKSCKCFCYTSSFLHIKPVAARQYWSQLIICEVWWWKGCVLHLQRSSFNLRQQQNDEWKSFLFNGFIFLLILFHPWSSVALWKMDDRPVTWFNRTQEREPESLSSLGTAWEDVPWLLGDIKHTTAAFTRDSSPEVCCCRHI